MASAKDSSSENVFLDPHLNGTLHESDSSETTTNNKKPAHINEPKTHDFDHWQLVNSPKSYHGSTSSQESSHSSLIDTAVSSSTSTSSRSSAETKENTRIKRLDVLRRTFLHSYNSIAPSVQSSEAHTSTFTGMLEDFAEKVGIRSSKRTIV